MAAHSSIMYEMEKILRYKEGKSGTLYYVKWKGYSDEHNTWEPQENFDPQDIEDYMERLKQNLIKRTEKSKEILIRRKIEEAWRKATLEEQAKRRKQRKLRRDSKRK